MEFYKVPESINFMRTIDFKQCLKEHELDPMAEIPLPKPEDLECPEDFDPARDCYLGVDIGGTFIKAGLFDREGKMIASGKCPTGVEMGADRILYNIIWITHYLVADVSGRMGWNVRGIGIGCPGMIESATSKVIYANNLGWENFDLYPALRYWYPYAKIRVGNDANVAALGEVKYGAAKGKKSAIMITLGTGVGGGIILDGKIVEGERGAGAELGHSVIVHGGEPCTCGRRGCFEAYSSASALIRDTKRAMEAHPDSKMWEIGSTDAVDGKTVFDYAPVDVYAKEVLDSYIEHLACGLINYANIFRPEVIILGGGVCAQGDNLIVPLQKILDREIYAGEKGPRVPIRVAELENDAGMLGGLALVFD